MPAILLKLFLEVLMKIADLLPSFLRSTDTTLTAPILSDFNLPMVQVPANPFEAMEAHLAELIAVETQARAAHEEAVRALNEHGARLKLTLETHLSSINALYTRVPDVNTEKNK